LIHYYEDDREELYNLKQDVEENNNVIADHTKLAQEMSAELFSYLNSVGAKFPEKDPEYSSELEKMHLERVINNLWPALEKQRLNMLSKDFDPKNDWWGSQIID
jgi:hypothetical protein